jgi:OTU domain-containing protein 3
MASRRPRTSSPRAEFPILEANGLYAVKTRGDGEFGPTASCELRLTKTGNCLFNALSDQLYGHQDENGALRDATIAHMRLNADFYRQYMTVGPSRRNPKRQAAALSTRVDTTYHTEEELQRQFDLHVEKMGQPGEWADNMEVSAFASALNVHVRLWQADCTYTLSPRGYYDNEAGAEDDRAVLNIAYHVSWFSCFVFAFDIRLHAS